MTRLQQYIAGLLTDAEMSAFPKRNAELTGDGFIDGRDVTQLLQYIANLIDHFEIEDK